jgi:thiol-disulfide isomerase/thioredoxin
MKLNLNKRSHRFSVIAEAIIIILFVTACSTGGLSKSSETAFVSGSGAAVFIKVADRKLAPHIFGLTLSGDSINLSSKKVTVLNVWASWCSPCRAEAPVLQDFSQRYSEVQFVGVLTRDNLTAARSFVTRFKLTYPTLIDDSILLNFRGSLIPNAIPTTLIIDADGYVAARVSGEVSVGLLRDLLTRVLAEPHHA